MKWVEPWVKKNSIQKNSIQKNSIFNSNLIQNDNFVVDLLKKKKRFDFGWDRTRVPTLASLQR